MLARDLPVTALRDSRLFSGVLALESAGYFHGMNMYGVTPVVLMTDGVKAKLLTSYVKYVPHTSAIKDDIVQVSGRLYVTTPERTICDLVIVDGNDEFIYQSLESYLAKFGTAETLLRYADKYGCREEMSYRLATLSDNMR